MSAMRLGGIIMIEGLIIAAGLSSRMGSNKLLLDLAGQQVIRRTVMSVSPFCDSTIVVTGHSAELIQKALSAVPRIGFVNNPLYLDGMLSSVKAGLRQLKADRCIFMPGDCPLVGHAVIERLLSEQGDIIVPRHEGKAGHPVVFSRKAMDALNRESGFSTLRDFVDGFGPRYVDVDCRGILMDIDTEADYRAALSYLASSREEGAD